MRTSTSEFLQAAAGIGAGEPLEIHLTSKIYLNLLENQLAAAAERYADLVHDVRPDPTWHQFETVLLRHSDPRKWRNFLDGLRTRKGWWMEKEGSRGKEWVWAGDTPKWIREFCGWLPDENGNWRKEDNPVYECLERAREAVKEIYYPDRGGREEKLPLREKDDVEALLLRLSENLRASVLREILLRLVRRGLQ